MIHLLRKVTGPVEPGSVITLYVWLQVITSESRGGVSAECRDPPSCVTLEAEAVTVPGMASSLHTEH